MSITSTRESSSSLVVPEEDEATEKKRSSGSVDNEQDDDDNKRESLPAADSPPADAVEDGPSASPKKSPSQESLPSPNESVEKIEDAEEEKSPSSSSGEEEDDDEDDGDEDDGDDDEEEEQSSSGSPSGESGESMAEPEPTPSGDAIDSKMRETLTERKEGSILQDPTASSPHATPGEDSFGLRRSSSPDGVEEEEWDEEIEEEETAEKLPSLPKFVCHEATGAPPIKKGRRTSASKHKKSKYALMPSTSTNAVPLKNYAKIHIQPQHTAILRPFPTLITKLSEITHHELIKYDCVRCQAIGSCDRQTETLERKLTRLKIYQRAFQSLIIQFSAYYPLLKHIKRAFDDLLRLRLKEFTEAQEEKAVAYLAKAKLERGLETYRYPEEERLEKAELHLDLLRKKVKAQDEAVVFLSNTLRKMERALSSHLSKQVEYETLTKALDLELTGAPLLNRLEHEQQQGKRRSGSLGKAATKSLEEGGSAMTDEMKLKLGMEIAKVDVDEDDDGEGDDDEEMEEDKKQVLLLAYAICMRDLEKADKKIKLYERKKHLQKQLKKKMGLAVDDEDDDDDDNGEGENMDEDDEEEGEDDEGEGTEEDEEDEEGGMPKEEKETNALDDFI